VFLFWFICLILIVFFVFGGDFLMMRFPIFKQRMVDI